MNTKKTKGKNKPRTVPENLNQSQTDENNVGKPEGIVEEKPETAIKCEERVPEIISENFRPSEEEKEIEFDTPKKPKRNRGKKKRTEKADDEGFKKNKSTEEIINDTVIKSEEKVHKKPKNSDQETGLPNITAAARKKKNKNKKYSDSEETKFEETEKEEVSTEVFKSKEIYSSQEILIKEPSDAELKTPKKKNKKKKRNDSEKSDKNEEIISCTAAFQKLLEPKDDKKELKKENKVNEPIKPAEITNTVSTIELSTSKGTEKKNKKKKSNDSEKNDKVEEVISSTATLKNVLELNYDQNDITRQVKINEPSKPVKISNLESAIDLASDQNIQKIGTQNYEDAKILQQTNEESNSKKTNKKEQIQLSKEPIEVDSQQNLEHTQERQLKSIIQPVEATVILEKDCTKSKAKIAKPVEKKHKNKSEEITEVITASKISEENIDELEEKPVMTKTDKEAIQASKVEVGKSRKEPHKLHQTDELKISEEIKDDKLEATLQNPPKSSTSKNFTPESTVVLRNDAETREVSALLTLLTEGVSTQLQSKDAPAKSFDQICNITEAITNTLEVEYKPELTQNKDDKKSNNKKKSPILPKKLESVEISEAKSFQPTKKDKSDKTQGKKYKDITLSPSFKPLLEDVEITSVKADESEESICDIVPDVQYPRASSLDNNNNIVIQDITAEFTEKLNIPVIVPDTPLITGSGETPVTTPEVVASGIKVTELNLKSSKEKTDLKSKVMEVNKDMEDLRLSIERSLAELTAIEKSEQEVEKNFEDSKKNMKIQENKIKNEDVPSLKKEPKTDETQLESPLSSLKEKTKNEDTKSTNLPIETSMPPVFPARKDNKGKGKSKKKGKQENEQQTNTSGSSTTAESSAVTESSASSERKETLKEKNEKSDQKTEEQKGKQQCDSVVKDNTTSEKADFEPIESFEDAMTSSADDVNKTFEMIANGDNIVTKTKNDKINLAFQNNPAINVTAPTEDNEKPDDDDKNNPVPQPKNLLGHPDIPVRLNKTDYKKEKNKTPNERKARVNIKDSIPIDKSSKESQTEFIRKYLKDKSSVDDTVNCMTSENEEFVYKYSFRKVFLPSACHVCKKELKLARFPCSYCNLVFYCSPKHKGEDYTQHQGFCFAVSTIVHLKNQKHIYADAQNITGHDYRLLRMQMIVSCEKVLKRKLTPCEQEILLYPRICADVGCREWRQTKLKDCDGCGQISFCEDRPDHFPKSHQRWCKSYALYQKLVTHQQTLGRLEPRLPARVMTGIYRIHNKINEVLASMYEEKIDMNDIQYASLTQSATAPLTAAYCQQLYTNKMNSSYANGVLKKSTYTLHVVGAELQFEADALNKWEVFFLHLRPDVTDLRVVLIGHDLNPSNLPLELLAKIRLCENCRQNKRRVIFDFQDGKSYHEYWSTDFITPDLVCTFNPSIQRTSIYNVIDHWASAIKCILKLKVPFVVTAYTMIELHRDLARIKEVSDIDVNVISEPSYNSFASVRPDRNFISDDEMPLLFKNYCFMLISGVL